MLKIKDRDRLRQLMADRGVGMRGLAAIAGYTNGAHGHVQRLLGGQTDYLAEHRAIAIETHLGVTRGDIFTSEVQA